MSRRVFWQSLLVIGGLLSGSLSAALGASPSVVLLTPTVGPLTDPAYLPLVAKAAQPVTALPTASATATEVTATASATQMTATATTSTATAEPTASATAATTSTATATASSTVTAEPTVTATGTSTSVPPTATATASSTVTAEPTVTATGTSTSTSVPPTATATASSTVTAEPTVTATATQPAAGHQLTLNMFELLQWTETVTGSGYDLVIVLDISYSMRFCWDTGKLCPAGSRRIDYAAAAIRGFVDEMLVQRYNRGIENRLALVTFSQGATKVIPFNNDRVAALAAFKDYFGDLSSPKTLPDSMFTANTSTASGLIAANEYLNNARAFDAKGNPVRQAVLLFNDGLANVFSDGPATRVTNGFRNAPYYCGETAEDMDNPLVQYTCPAQADYPGQVISTPPLKAMVAAADAARAARPVQFYAVLLGEQFGLNPAAMHLTEVAPDHAYMANSAAQLEGLVNAIEAELDQVCTEYVSNRTPAAGASVTISDQAGDPVGTFTVDAQGRLAVSALPPGAYTLSAAHLAVIAPADPLQQPRNYTRMVVDNGGIPQDSLAFVMPDDAHALPDIRLVIDNPVNAQCP